MSQKQFKILHFFSDILLINLAFAIANFIRFQEFWVDGWSYPSLLIVVNLSMIIGHFVSFQNQINASYSFRYLFYNTLEYIIIISFFVLIYWFVIHDLLYSRIHITSFFICAFVLLLYSKLYYINFLRKQNLEHQGLENSLVLGTSIYTKKFVNYLLKNKWTGFNYVGTINREDMIDPNQLDIKDIQAACEKQVVKNIFINIADVKISDNFFMQLRDFSERNLIKILILSQIHQNHIKNSYHTLIGEYPAVFLFALPLDGLKNKLIKRVFDILFSILFIVFVLSWLIPIVAILIKLESKGPVFFIQKRQGKDNCMFGCIKFRSMKYDVNANFSQATKNDVRITKVGAFLRKSNIDEMPQFINVLLGDMSVVGPRPHVIEHNLEFAHIIDKFYARHLFKPGVTGLAQVRGFRGEITSNFKMSGRVKLDRYYLYNWNLWMDIKIIWMTFRNAVMGDPNAY